MKTFTREQVRADFIGGYERIFASHPDHAATPAETRARDFEEALVAYGLRRLAPCIERVAALCAAGQAVDAASARRIAEGVHVFAPATEQPGIVALAVTAGDASFVARVQRGLDGDLASVTVWTFEPAGAAIRQTGEVASLSVVAHPAAGGKPFISMRGRGGGEAFLRFTEIMESALEAAKSPAEDARVHIGGAVAYLAGGAVALDGGHVGPFCRSLAREGRTRGILLAAKSIAETLAANHDDLVELDYVFGKKRLQYSDTDKRCFAIPTGDRRLAALVHENIDLIADACRFLVVLSRADDGRVECIEVHEVAVPRFDDEAADGPADGGDDVPTVVFRPSGFTQAELARALQSGEALPEPALAIDLRDDTVRVGPISADSALPLYLPYIARNDRWILDRLKHGEDPGIGFQSTAEFGDEDYEAAMTGAHRPR